MSEHLRLTTSAVTNLAAPVTGKAVYWDDRLPGFGVRVLPSGTKTFFVQGRTEAGKQFMLTVGRFGTLAPDAAYQKAKGLLGDVAKGKDPAEEKRAARAAERARQAAPRMRDLCERYEREHLPTKRESSAAEDRRLIRQYVLAKMPNKKVADVTREQIAEWHRSLKDKPFSANRLLALLSKMFSLAVDEWKMRPDNPCKGIPRFPEESRETFLSQAEIARLSDTLASWPDQTVAAAIRFLLLTGARRGEVMNATWNQFDLERGTWTKPSHHTKTKRRHVVPLSAPARELLAGLPRDDEQVFPGLGRLTMKWQRIKKRAGLDHVRLHDLRHSAASILASRGASIQVIGRLLGHTRIETSMKYSHLTDTALMEAVESIGDAVNSAGEKSAEVVRLRKT
jgi:integrase